MTGDDDTMGIAYIRTGLPADVPIDQADYLRDLDAAYARGFAAGLEQAAGLRALLRKCRLFVTYSQFSAGYQDENGKSQSYRSEDVRDEIDAAIRALDAPPAESS